MTPRGWIGLGVILALLAALGTAAFQTSRANGLAHQVDGYKACEAAVEGKPKAKPAAQVCSKAIAAADQIADRALACDGALTVGNTYGLGNYCSTPVKTLDARLGVADRTVASLQAELKADREDRAAALADAETRGRLNAERKARAAAAVAAAPRDSAGLVVCDAGCVRDRWGSQAPGAARP